MKAMILAAGRGERMRPLSDATPKPLLCAGGKPLITWHIQRLVQAGITQIVINHAWLGEQFETTLGDGSQMGAQIVYSPENPSLETAGGIANALPYLGDQPFLVINGDIWCDWNPQQAPAIAVQLSQQAKQAWLLLVDNPGHHPSGDFSLNEAGAVVPPSQTAGRATALTFAGIGIYQPSLFAPIPAGLPAPLAPLLRAAIENKAVLGQHYTGHWTDVGTPERLARLNQQLSNAAIP